MAQEHHPLVKELQEALTRMEHSLDTYKKYPGLFTVGQEVQEAHRAYNRAEDAIREELVRLAGEDLVETFAQLIRDECW